jgi:hypothetical protein
MPDFYLVMTRGDDRVATVTAAFPEAIPAQDVAAGDPYPLVGKTVWFTAKRRASDADADAVFQKKTGGGGITVRPSPDEHVAEVEIDAADTAGVSSSGETLFCDVQTKNEDGKVWTVARGHLEVSSDLTRSTA